MAGEALFEKRKGTLRRHAVAAAARCHEAFAAENRSSALFNRSRFEGDLALRAALGADGVVHFAVSRALRLPR